MTIRWTPRAFRDLEQIADYLQVNAPEIQISMPLEINAAIGSLASLPLRGRPTSRKHVRQLILVKMLYVITYRVSEETVQILRIRHGARKPLEG